MPFPSPSGVPAAVTRTLREHPLSPFRAEAFRSPLHAPRTAVSIGRLLGLCLTISFVTGLYSHFLQEPAEWMRFPTDPSWLYRFSQGLHVATGTVAVPLLLAKLWTVYPRLFVWPPLRSPRHAVERLSVFVFVAAVLLELFTGFLNTVKWYIWPFPFRQTHFALAWIIIGSLLIHIGVKLPFIRRHWRRTTAPERAIPGSEPSGPTPSTTRRPESGWTRRGLFGTTAAAAVAVTVATVGQTVEPLSRFALLAPRDPRVGPQGLPINRTAAQARVLDTAVDPNWRLVVAGPRTVVLGRAELAALPQSTVELPIACVEGWSRSATWTGVPVTDLLTLVGAPPDAECRVESLERRGGYRTSTLTGEFTVDRRTLLALRLNGETLHIEHGYPARVIAPARPGVLQTKWVHRLEVLA